MATFIKLAREYRENQKMINELKKINEEIKAALILELHGEEERTEQDITVSYKKIISNTFDQASFKKNNKELYDSFLKQKESYRFNAK